jgi:pimeloyl-ACP methyl ester carboxylesterase
VLSLAPPLVSALEPVRCPAEARSLDARVRCGFVRVLLDRSDASSPTIRVYFERYPRNTAARRVATVLSIEGGPGFSTTADRAARVALWRPLAARRPLLLVDLRGTGRSGALACRAFARSSRGYAARVGRCAAQLGRRRDHYSTAASVEDLEAVLRALGLGRVDLYGDSYGSYAAEAFAVRHASRLRSIVLDSTYPLPGTDPAWADLIAAARRGLRLACARWPLCPAHGRDPVPLVTAFATRVRAKPIVGFAPDGDGNRVRVKLDEDALAQLVGSGYYYPGLWRELVAAVLAAKHGYAAPILRLAAETVTVDAGPAAPSSYSEALYAAVTCHDYPQLWDPLTPIAARAAEAQARLAAYPPGTFAPLGRSAWAGTDYEGVLACLRWPAPVEPDPPIPPASAYPAVPTLVLNGDLDSITASSGAREVARRFPESTFVEFANSSHVIALYDHGGCGSGLYRRFVRTLSAGDASCARRVPETHVVGAFARSPASVTAARPLRGDRSSSGDRRLAAAAAATVADVLVRWWINYDGTGVGLHGGAWRYEGDETVVFKLEAVQLVPGVPVSGTVRWSRRGPVRATVRVRRAASLRLRWSLGVPRAAASLDGRVGGRTLRATMPAP